MSTKLPPPDPFETLGMAPAGDMRLLAPTAVYVGGPPTAETERVSKQMLDLRPGALIVVALTAKSGQ